MTVPESSATKVSRSLRGKILVKDGVQARVALKNHYPTNDENKTIFVASRKILTYYCLIALLLFLPLINWFWICMHWKRCSEIIPPKTGEYAAKYASNTVDLDQKQLFIVDKKLYLLHGDKCWKVLNFSGDFVFRKNPSGPLITVRNLLRKSISRSKRLVLCTCN